MSEIIADSIAFWVAHPFAAGIFFGGIGLAGPLGIIGWCVGHDSAMRKVTAWMHPPKDEAHGDVPNLPPDRPRRWIPTEGRS